MHLFSVKTENKIEKFPKLDNPHQSKSVLWAIKEALWIVSIEFLDSNIKHA